MSDDRWLISFLFHLFIALVFGDASQQQLDSDNVEIVALVSLDLHLNDVTFFELTEPLEVAYIYKIRPAKNFGSSMNYTLIAVELVLTSPQDSCSPISNANYLRGNVAFVERGGCSFLSKAINAEYAGAIAIIIADNDVSNDDTLIEMTTDETSRTSNIPAFFMLGRDGFMIMKTFHKFNIQSAVINIPINITASSTLPRNLPPWSLW